MRGPPQLFWEMTNFHPVVQMKTHGPCSTSSVMSNPKTMPKREHNTKPGDHTPDVDHGVVNVATREPKSETVIESSEQCVHDLHIKTDPEYELTCNVAILKSESMEDSKRSSAVLAMLRNT